MTNPTPSIPHCSTTRGALHPHRFLMLWLYLWLYWNGCLAAGSVTPELPAESIVHKTELRARGLDLLAHGHIHTAAECGRRLLRLAEREKDRAYCELYGHLILGLAGIETDRTTESYAHLTKARLIAEQTHNHDALASVFNGFGNYALFVNDDAYSAISCYFQALEEAKLLNNRRLYAIYLSNIAGAYTQRDDLSGLKFAEEAVAVARQCGEPVPLYYGLMNQAYYHLLTDSLIQAQATLQEAERINEMNGFSEQSDIDCLKAQLYAKQGKREKAGRLYLKILDDGTSVAPSTLTMTYLQYARLLREDNHLDQSIRTLERGLKRIDAQGAIPIHKAQLLKELLLCHRQAGSYSQSLEYALQYQDYQKHLFDDTRERALQETRIKHDLYTREQRISEQEVEILRNRYHIAILVLILTVMVIVMALIGYFYHKKNVLYRAIVQQNRDYLQREKLLLQRQEHPEPSSSSIPAVHARSNDRGQELMVRFTTLMMEQALYTDSTLTISTVAEALDTNRTYLSKAINELAGKSFTQLVNEYRIRRAIAEISDLAADKPLKQIAAEAGFSSLSTFYSTFQASTGMTPARYRTKLKELDAPN